MGMLCKGKERSGTKKHAKKEGYKKKPEGSISESYRIVSPSTSMEMDCIFCLPY